MRIVFSFIRIVFLFISYDSYSNIQHAAALAKIGPINIRFVHKTEVPIEFIAKKKISESFRLMDEGVQVACSRRVAIFDGCNSPIIVVLKIFPTHPKDYSPRRVKKGIRAKLIYTSKNGPILESHDEKMLREEGLKQAYPAGSAI